MAKTTNKVMLQWVGAMLVIAMLGETMALPICNIDSSKLQLCLPAVSGDHPAPPTRECCEVVRKVDLPCLCGYKNALPALHIEPKYAFALPKKCGFRTPRACHLA